MGLGLIWKCNINSKHINGTVAGIVLFSMLCDSKWVHKSFRVWADGCKQWKEEYVVSKEKNMHDKKPHFGLSYAISDLSGLQGWTGTSLKQCWALAQVSPFYFIFKSAAVLRSTSLMSYEESRSRSCLMSFSPLELVYCHPLEHNPSAERADIQLFSSFLCKSKITGS